MRESEYRRLLGLFEAAEVPLPRKSAEALLPTLDSAAQERREAPSLYTQMLVNTLASAGSAAPPQEVSDQKAPEFYQKLIRAVPKVQKQHMANYAAVLLHQRKIAGICVRELRRGLSKTSKTNPSLKNKRINKELQRLVGRLNRAEREKSKKEDAEMEIRKRNDEVEREEMRQKRKFNYLMSQTEAFASFFLNRQKKEGEGAGEEGTKAAMEHLANVKEFDKPERPASAEPGGRGDAAYVYREISQPRILKTTLKSYQLKGLNWLVNLYNQGINGILADDMGLGKTVQAISLLGYLAEVEDVWGLFLVITPASTLHNWENEFAKFIPDFRVVVYYGSLQERTELRKRFKQAHVVVTSYQVAVSDESILRKIRWQYMLLDEAQAIKSISSQRWRTLLSFKARNRCLLTGTPIQNNMQELWSLLHFIMPTLFDSLSEFSEWFLTENGLDATQVDKLHTILKPFMLRRHKDDIKDEIGLKKMHSIHCQLSTRQRVLYNDIINPQRNFEFMLRGGSEQADNSNENTIMHLKKVCNHPDLFEKPEARSALCLAVDGGGALAAYRSDSKRYISPATVGWAEPGGRAAAARELVRLRAYDARAVKRKLEPAPDIVRDLLALDVAQKRRRIANNAGRFVFYTEKVGPSPVCSNLALERRKVVAPQLPPVLPRPLRFYDRMTFAPPINTFIADSGKLVALDSLLAKLKAEGHRPLIYFQMTRMMDLFEEYLVKKEYSYLRLDGSCKVSARKELVHEWQTKDIFAFILSTRAGGVGINLTAADTVIFYDSDWNPTVDQQAMDRVHRLGQTKEVAVYRLITKDSIEEKIMERAMQKDEMQKMVIKGNVFEGNYK
ncbi:chromatin-remodeling ATPase INO80 [Pancytospora philotis]|nr:chromatin-remodeling ATPase INO80 [Pancytospora philotis]